MTTTSWTTTADIPPAPWAAAGADIRRLLAVTAAGGAKVTGPTGIGNPVINETTIAFTVTAPGSQPLTIRFDRAAGTGSATTSAPHTDGLVLAAVHRAVKHWGALVEITSDADTTSQAAGRTLLDGLFAADDDAVTGTGTVPVWVQLAQIVGRAANAAEDAADLGAALDAVIAQLTAERAGITAATALLPR